jgi:hypothetical protein
MSICEKSAAAALSPKQALTKVWMGGMGVSFF